MGLRDARRPEILWETAEKGCRIGGVECPKMGLGSFGMSIGIWRALERWGAFAGCWRTGRFSGAWRDWWRLEICRERELPATDWLVLSGDMATQLPWYSIGVQKYT
jgi:hypothetical protein